ncbi:MAG: DinB family protein [Candidatus Hodarchaeales archaeon]|jgi:uncharacterized damage-inducible protein DinB
MEINDIKTFLDYYKRIRERTLKVIECIPQDKIDWSPRQGKMTFGDIIRHIATIERHLYAEIVQGKPSKYAGYDKKVSEDFSGVIDFMKTLHKESLQIFNKLTSKELQQKCQTPTGTFITTWKWLRAMIEHEIHHRGHIYSNLGYLGLKTPPIFGLTSEEVLERKNK